MVELMLCGMVSTLVASLFTGRGSADLEGGHIAFSLNGEGMRWTNLVYCETESNRVELGASSLSGKKSNALVITSENLGSADPWAATFKVELMFGAGAATSQKYCGSGLRIHFAERDGAGKFVEGSFEGIELTRDGDPSDTIVLADGSFRCKWHD